MTTTSIEEWLKTNKPTNCDGFNHTTLERTYDGTITGRRDSIKTAKKKLRIIKNLHKK